MCSSQHNLRDKCGVFGGALAGRRRQLGASGDPIKIGLAWRYGPLAPNGKQALLGAKIWEEEINAKGGLLAARSSL